ncbi:MAG: hypothetical protein ACLSDQ_13740 [Adlercreutzia equolifaciens]
MPTGARRSFDDAEKLGVAVVQDRCLSISGLHEDSCAFDALAVDGHPVVDDACNCGQCEFECGAVYGTLPAVRGGASWWCLRAAGQLGRTVVNPAARWGVGP